MRVPVDVVERIRVELSKACGISTSSIYVSNQVIPLVENILRAGDKIIAQATDAMVYGHRYTWHEYDEQIISQEMYKNAWDLFCINIAITIEADGNCLPLDITQSVVEGLNVDMPQLLRNPAMHEIWNPIATDAAPYRPSRLYSPAHAVEIVKERLERRQ